MDRFGILPWYALLNRIAGLMFEEFGGRPVKVGGTYQLRLAVLDMSLAPLSLSGENFMEHATVDVG